MKSLAANSLHFRVDFCHKKINFNVWCCFFGHSTKPLDLAPRKVAKGDSKLFCKMAKTFKIQEPTAYLKKSDIFYVNQINIKTL